MEIKRTEILKTNEKGQTLLFVVVAVTIALTVGIAVSTRTIGSLKRVSRTDTSARVIAVAEGGIENLLGRSYSQLNSATTPSVDTCEDVGADYLDSESFCVYNFTPQKMDGDVINTRAIVKVEKFNSNEIDGGYSFTLEPDSVKEVNLEGYTPLGIQICWKEPETLIYYYSYDDEGNVLKGGLYGDSPKDSDGFEGADPAPSDREGYERCKEVDLVGAPGEAYGLRIRVLYQPSVVGVFPTEGAELPDQGYKLTSKGELSSNQDSQEAATVIVYKSYPYASGIFDFGIYTPNELRSAE